MRREERVFTGSTPTVGVGLNGSEAGSYFVRDFAPPFVVVPFGAHRMKNNGEFITGAIGMKAGAGEIRILIFKQIDIEHFDNDAVRNVGRSSGGGGGGVADLDHVCSAGVSGSASSAR